MRESKKSEGWGLLKPPPPPDRIGLKCKVLLVTGILLARLRRQRFNNVEEKMPQRRNVMGIIVRRELSGGRMSGGNNLLPTIL